jgi:uncharacterized protein YecE (DUF72 family)
MPAAKSARAWIGISGWNYPAWRGGFYPKGLAQRLELWYASRSFNSIEINGSFYSLQRPESYAAWRDQAPDDFRFAVKGGRFITHMKKLRDVETPLANFFASGVLALGPKLGPVLWQFPAMLRYDEERFDAFFRLLPRDQPAAAALAKRHDAKVAGRTWTKPLCDGPIRYAVEIRHPSFLDPRFVALLRRHNVALCFADTAGIWPYAEDVTADFVYVRLHGAERLYWSGYTDAQLDWWAARLAAWMAGREPPDARRVSTEAAPKGRAKARDAYVYFDNDAQVRAPFDAAALLERVTRRPWPRPEVPGRAKTPRRARAKNA